MHTGLLASYAPLEVHSLAARTSLCCRVGLTYSYFIRASTDTRSVSFGLFKCTDLLGAYSAAKKIVVDYASGASEISAVDLDGSKSTVAYSIIQGTSTRLSAAAAAWESAYEGKGVDYGEWLLTQVDDVSPDDVLHAIKKYVLPLFDPSANLAATCPPNKLDSDAEGLQAALGVPVRKLQEDSLYSAFEAAAAAEDGGETAVDVSAQEAPRAPSAVRTRPGYGATAAFAFAKSFKCECPKCVVPAKSEI